MKEQGIYSKNRFDILRQGIRMIGRRMPMVDCRGMACPQPVITTRQALDHLREEELVIMVDNASSCRHVERFAQS